MKELIKGELNKGITQRELANKVHVSQGTIQKILFTDTKFTYETKKKVADYFGVPVSDFYDGTTGPGEPKAAEPPASRDPLLQSLLLNIQQLTDAVKASNERIDAQGTHIGNIGKALDRLNDSVQEYAQTGDRSALKKLRDAG